MSDVVSWVVGSHGLLGRAVVRELGRRGEPVVCGTVPWGDTESSIRSLDVFARQLSRRHRRWRIVWCAGAGVIGSVAEALHQEIVVIDGFLDRMGDRVREDGPRDSLASLFYASSAGGAYAGSVDPPFTETTEPEPTSAYGDAKLAVEEYVKTFEASTGVPVVIGRITNLYGPGQDLSKAEGLISQLCRAHLTHRPLSVYVSLDTARDYLYVDDCARMLLEVIESVEILGGCQVKILASQRSTTIASVLSELQRVTKRRPCVVLGASPLSRIQAKDLRFRSEVMTEVDRHASTPLAAGIGSTLESLAHQMRVGRICPD